MEIQFRCMHAKYPLACEECGPQLKAEAEERLVRDAAGHQAAGLAAIAHASPRPWTYHRTGERHAYAARDWIEDAHGNVVVQSVGWIDGPLICAAVNAYKAEGGK